MRVTLSKFSLIILLLISSCKKDDTSDLIISSELIGKWQLAEIVHHTMILQGNDVVEYPSYQIIYEFQPVGSFI